MKKMKKMKKKKTKIGSAIRSPKALEVKYRKALNKLGRALAGAVREKILPYLKSNEKTYTVDSVSSDLLNLFNLLNRDFTGVITTAFAQNTATQMVNGLATNNKKRFDRSIKSVTGVDLGNIIATEGLEDFIQLNINANVSLIKDMPTKYLKQIEVVVSKGMASGARYSTIAKEIYGINNNLSKRIKTIATNEMQTINSQITLRRNESLGIKEGIYRSSKDERVRQCHKELDGVQYKLSQGAWSKTCQKYIIPGITDINCRCSFSPIIELDEV